MGKNKWRMAENVQHVSRIRREKNMSSNYCTQITTGQFMKVAMVGKPAKAENIVDWKKELNEIMIDFCIPKNVRDDIISMTEKENPNDSTLMLYNKAWRKFMSAM